MIRGRTQTSTEEPQIQSGEMVFGRTARPIPISNYFEKCYPQSFRMPSCRECCHPNLESLEYHGGNEINPDNPYIEQKPTSDSDNGSRRSERPEQQYVCRGIFGAITFCDSSGPQCGGRVQDEVGIVEVVWAKDKVDCDLLSESTQWVKLTTKSRAACFIEEHENVDSKYQK